MQNLIARDEGLLFHFGTDLRIEIGNLEQRGIAERIRRHPHLGRREPGRGQAAAFAVAAVVHLARRGDQVAPGDRLRRGQPDHATAAFHRRLVHRRLRQAFEK